MERVTKDCSKCGETKLLTEYYKRQDGLHGVYARCKDCVSKSQKDSRDRINEATRARKLRDPEGEKLKSRVSREKSKDKDRARSMRWRAENPEAVSRQATEWRKDNPDAAREISSKYNRKIRSTAKGRLESNVARGVHRGLTNGSKAGRRTFDLLGYSPDELKMHLEAQFTDGMTWRNYGEWHVDHVMPLAAFNYETPDDFGFKMAWALTNLQPLWAKDNMSKGKRLPNNHRPSSHLHVLTNL